MHSLLSKHEKATDVEFLNNLYNPYVICGTESWMDPSVKTEKYFPLNFSLFRKDSKAETTGVEVFRD